MVGVPSGYFMKLTKSMDWEFVNMLNEAFAQIRIGLLGEPCRNADIIADARKHIEATRFSP